MSILVRLISVILIFMPFTDDIIYDFSINDSVQKWQVVNDGVMGGLSNSKIGLTENGHGKFEGHVSLANNGGFASVRLLTNVDLKTQDKFIKLRVKGDGKSYQFRLKGTRNQRQSYVHEFDTNGEWQTIKLKINKFSPQFRGKQFELPNFDFSKIEEVRFLIANKREENFILLIDSIILTNE